MTTQKDTTYNGWTNWDTWNAYNWLTSDEWTYDQYLSCRNVYQLEDFLRSVVDIFDEDIDIADVNLDELLEAEENK